LNKTEYLLTCLNEECTEIAQATCKALRFGLDDHYPGKESNNLQDIHKELCDLLGVVELIQEEGIFLYPACDRQSIQAKKEKVNKYMEYSQNRGTLDK
jgi:NTP pyrophosphatase (non-canonical NTP hydrolase)